VRVAVFGGSFNPPHVAHVLAATFVLATEDVERLLVVPTYRHPFAKALAPFDDRVAMCEAALGWLPGVEVSRVEEALGGDSLTLRTLERLRDEHPEWELRLVVGADVLAETSKWYRWHDVQALAPPIVLGRAGVTAAGAPPALLPEISSTRVRELVARGAWAELAPLVPRRVLDHVRKRGLYGTSS
jgi:nicotinate-nucleotide adenylyltransferase